MVGEMDEIFKHVVSLDESDDDYVDFTEEEGEGFFEEEDEEFVDTVNEQSENVESIGHEHLGELDPFSFRSDHNWYLFTKSSYSLMIQCVIRQFQPTGDSILNADPSFNVPNEPIEKLHRHVMKKWKALEVALSVRLDPLSGELKLYNETGKFSHLRIPYVEEWEQIVKDAHESKLPHHGVKATHNNITNMGWLVGARVHGLPSPYLENFVRNCLLCSTPKISHIPSSSSQPKKNRIQYDVLIQVQPEELEDIVKEIIHQYKASC